ncbi:MULTISPECIES: carbohydrate kinase family protein [unclassified Granulicatella]|uniref:carbohydrate kinase family protein n=1 Tax=unclassified Granulicatella TaxID=2630493 RepID=UPI00107436E9|nr:MULTISPECIES: PfkB family carbohydrate kinase [unclassified Granulicatella]MBF0780429.1 bifunctional hydroxymethylpyrimidine kinase/phosphomethylpyrimidine kinase [Granulicatella sp. 19428wC4_WM01]TFU95418.1 carbohydrate kinase family protein [Granulicatella sp. WM01]
MGKCLVIGSTVCDVMMYIDKLPQTQQDIHLHKQKISVGGCAYNVVSILHHLNVDYTFISPVGTGMYGDFILKELQRTGIQTTIRQPFDNGCCYCVVEADGERTFMSYHGAEYTFNPEWLEALSLDEYDYIYICGLEVEDVDGEKLVSVLSKCKGQIVFCPGPRGKNISPQLLKKIYDNHPIIHLNDTEIIELTQEKDYSKALRCLYRQTQTSIVMTKGKHGAVYFDGQAEHHVKGVPAQVVDTIGAGDSHVGAMIASLAKGNSLEKSIAFANIVASHIVATHGVCLSEQVIDTLKHTLEHVSCDNNYMLEK